MPHIKREVRKLILIEIERLVLFLGTQRVCLDWTRKKEEKEMINLMRKGKEMIMFIIIIVNMIINEKRKEK